MADSDTSTTTNAPWWPWRTPWTAVPSHATALWPWFGLAPQRLEQPINPGWSFGNIVTVTHMNSSAPDMERAISEQHSYGRQLGRIMDALSALVEAMPAGKRDDKRIEEFVEIARDVQAIKRRAELPQVERLRAELEEVRRDDPKAWAELAKVFGR